MLKFRTTKKMQTSLHSEETNIVEFRFRYGREKESSLVVKCDAYKIEDENELEIITLIPGGGKYTDITGIQLTTLMVNAVSMTNPITNSKNALTYMDKLVANGIKLYIIEQDLWKSQLTLNDFVDSV